MKIKIIFGSILAVFILTMLPLISAVEYDSVEKANEQYLQQLLKDSDIDPKQFGIIRNILRFILKIILLPFKIVKIIIKLLCKIFCLPFKIIEWILDIIT